MPFARTFYRRGQSAHRLDLVARVDGACWSAIFKPVNTRATDPAICYYTSGTTSEPKAVLHSHGYTYSHRFTGSTWLDLQPGDLHWTTSDTGWAKAAYGVLFGPWMNGMTVHVQRPLRSGERTRAARAAIGITNFLRAADRVSDAGQGQPRRLWICPNLRHCTGAGEPLNPEVIDVWREHFGLTIHDGYGQTETTIVAAQSCRG